MYSNKWVVYDDHKQAEAMEVQDYQKPMARRSCKSSTKWVV